MKTTRLALLYSDGSAGILPEDRSPEHAFNEAKEADFGEKNPRNFTTVARVAFEVLEILTDPSAAPEKNCPTCGGRRP